MRVEIEFKIDFEEVSRAIEQMLVDLRSVDNWYNKSIEMTCTEIIYCQSKTGEEYFACIVEGLPYGTVQYDMETKLARAGFNVRVIAKED